MMADATRTPLQHLLHHEVSKTGAIAHRKSVPGERFAQLEHSMQAFSNTTVSGISFFKAPFGEIPIRGYLPVTIPSLAQRRAGLQHLAQAANQGRSQHAQN
jgi:hypothetical protein